MKRKRLTRHEKFEQWHARWLIPTSHLTMQDIEFRMRLAYLDGYGAGQRHERKKRK